jgi:SAM-dependent methyltransferase
MEALPAVADVFRTAPRNPPESIQVSFVGAQYLEAFAVGASFVRVADEWSRRHRNQGFGSAARVVDFGSGWGRIARFLLAYLPPSAVYAVDVDIEMTALVNGTLPGVNALTIDPLPPTILRSATVDAVLAFSVFSHLSPEAHVAWASEFGRIVAPGGMAFITLLDAAFFHQLDQIRLARDAGDTASFTIAMADLLPDLDGARATFDRGEPVYAGTGGGGVRTGDYYGWAAIPTAFMQRTWGAAGFDIVEWVASGTLFPQAMVGLRRR